MMLMTKKIKDALIANHAKSADSGVTADVAPLKLFDMYGRWTLYAFELDYEPADEDGPEDGVFYGFVVSPLGPDCDEWGYSSLAEIKAMMKFGRPRMQRDMYFGGITKYEIEKGVRK